MLIIFDCDGVLVDSEVIANRVLAAHLSRHGYPVTARECREQFVGRTIPGVIDMVAAAGVRLPDDFERTLRVRDMEAFERELEPVNGVEDALRQLGGRPKCVASSGRHEKIKHSLEITGLYRLFAPHLFSAEDVAAPKPAPDLFLLAAARMNTDPGQCTVIEDTVLGVTAAKRAGMRVFGFVGAAHRSMADADTLKSAGADFVFDDMRALPNALS